WFVVPPLPFLRGSLSVRRHRACLGGTGAWEAASARPTDPRSVAAKKEEAAPRSAEARAPPTQGRWRRRKYADTVGHKRLPHPDKLGGGEQSGTRGETVKAELRTGVRIFLADVITGLATTPIRSAAGLTAPHSQRQALR